MEPITLTLAPFQSVWASHDSEPAYKTGGPWKWVMWMDCSSYYCYNCAFPAVTWENVCCDKGLCSYIKSALRQTVAQILQKKKIWLLKILGIAWVSLILGGQSFYIMSCFQIYTSPLYVSYRTVRQNNGATFPPWTRCVKEATVCNGGFEHGRLDSMSTISQRSAWFKNLHLKVSLPVSSIY